MCISDYDVEINLQLGEKSPLAHLCTKVTPRLHLTLHVFKIEGFVVIFKMIYNIALLLFFLLVVLLGFFFLINNFMRT